MENLINEEIKAQRVKVVGIGLGSTVLLNEALKMAETDGLDLVMVGGDSELPVCKIMDYSKYRYERAKKEKQSNKVKQETKEIKMSLRTSSNDMRIKAHSIDRILSEGDRVTVSITSKGRETGYIHTGVAKIDELTKMLQCKFSIVKQAKIEGNKVSMTLDPLK